jgi:hypothetical protein
MHTGFINEEYRTILEDLCTPPEQIFLTLGEGPVIL